MTREEKLAYGKGYNAGSRRAWPDHRPPSPPGPLMQRLMEAIQNLRDGTDSILAILDSGDEFAIQLGPKIDAVDEAMAAVSRWLKEGEG